MGELSDEAEKALAEMRRRRGLLIWMDNSTDPPTYGAAHQYGKYRGAGATIEEAIMTLYNVWKKAVK